MYTVTKEIQFDMAHRVPNHKSKCRNLHGHRYKVVVCAGIPYLQREGSDEGMVVDFGDLKRFMMEEIHDVFDHGAAFYHKDHLMNTAMNAVNDFGNLHWVSFIPTAENLAKHFYDLLVEAMGEHQLWWIEWVEVYETPTSVARYTA